MCRLSALPGDIVNSSARHYQILLHRVSQSWCQTLTDDRGYPSHGRIQRGWGVGCGVRTHFLAHVVGFLTLGPKLDPPHGPPFFACRTKNKMVPLFKNPGSAPAPPPPPSKKLYFKPYLNSFTLEIHRCRRECSMYTCTMFTASLPHSFILHGINLL